MVDEKGLSPESADKIGNYVQLNGKKDLVNKLLEDPDLKKSQMAVKGLEVIFIT